MQNTTPKTSLFRRAAQRTSAKPGSLFGRPDWQNAASGDDRRAVATARDHAVTIIRRWQDGGFVETALSA